MLLALVVYRHGGTQHKTNVGEFFHPGLSVAEHRWPDDKGVMHSFKALRIVGIWFISMFSLAKLPVKKRKRG